MTMRGGVATSKWRLGALFVCWGVLATLAGAVHSARDGRILISQKLYLKSIIPILLPNSLTLPFTTIAYLQLIRFIKSYWPIHLLPRAYYNICLFSPPQPSPNQPVLYVLSHKNKSYLACLCLFQEYLTSHWSILLLSLVLKYIIQFSLESH